MRAQLLSERQGRRSRALVLQRDDEVLTALNDFAARHAIHAAHITAIGALRDVQLGWYDLSRKACRVNPAPGQVEALAVIGDIGVARASRWCTCTRWSAWKTARPATATCCTR